MPSLRRRKKSFPDDWRMPGLRETGIRVKLRITLCRTAEGVEASAVQVVPQGALTDARKQAVEKLLTAQLQLEPESICWGEAVP